MTNASVSEPATSIPETGDPAPDATVQALDAAAVTLSDLWTHADRGLALVFLRHYGCSFCKEHAQEIERHRDDFAAAGLAVALVGCGNLDEAAAFQRDLGLTHPVLNDPGRIAYAAYGIGEASKGSLLNPVVALGGLRAVTKGHMPRRSSGNPLQLQGQFLIDREGVIRSATRPALMSDIPSATTLLDAAKALPHR